MKKLLLLLLSTPTVFSIITPLFTTADRVMAAGIEPAASISANGKFCVTAHSKLVCVKSSQVGVSPSTKKALIAQVQREAKNPDAFLNFTDEESNASIALFGCDCPACIRSLRQLRLMAPAT